MHPTASFKYCPACGAPGSTTPPQPFRCTACAYTLYINTTCATAAFLKRPDGCVLFIRRAKEPAKGKLAIPGGFIDPGETAEFGLRREFMEEVGIAVEEIHYLGSFPNIYHYKGITYDVLDFFFTAYTPATTQAASLDGVESYEWLHPREVAMDDLAFPSLRAALAAYIAHLDDIPF